MLPGMGDYMLDQVGTRACSRNEYLPGDRGRVLIHVRMDIDCNQTVSNSEFVVSSLLIQFTGHIVISAWNSLSSTLLVIV